MPKEASTARMEQIAEGAGFKLVARGAMMIAGLILLPLLTWIGARTLAQNDRFEIKLNELTTALRVLEATTSQGNANRYTTVDATRDKEIIDLKIKAIEARMVVIETSLVPAPGRR